MLCSSREESLYRTQERDETLSTIAKKLGLDADCLLKRNKRRLLGLNGLSGFRIGTKVERGTLVYYVEALDKFQGGSAASGVCDGRVGAGGEGSQSGSVYIGKVGGGCRSAGVGGRSGRKKGGVSVYADQSGKRCRFCGKNYSNLEFQQLNGVLANHVKNEHPEFFVLKR